MFNSPCDDAAISSADDRQRGFKRVRTKWENVMTWSLLHIREDDVNEGIARIMAKSLKDANVPVTPKHDAKEISHFRQKLVRGFISSLG